uniref:Uncharacterized protein n=1 Tax=Cacopsylla melanoneura TaxID=428564 RepID=A0A8D9AAS4_9HEMI
MWTCWKLLPNISYISMHPALHSTIVKYSILSFILFFIKVPILFYYKVKYLSHTFYFNFQFITTLGPILFYSKCKYLSRTFYFQFSVHEHTWSHSVLFSS